MTRTTKFSLAAALVAAGYGVASFLGSPNSPNLRRAVPERLASLSSSSADRQRSEDGGARLVPDLPHRAAKKSASRAELDDVESITPLLLTTTSEPMPAPSAVADDERRAPHDIEPPLLLETTMMGRAPDIDGTPANVPETVALSRLPRGKLVDVRPLPSGNDAWRNDAERVTIRSTPVLPPADVTVASFDSPNLPPTNGPEALQIVAKRDTERGAYTDASVAKEIESVTRPEATEAPNVRDGIPFRRHIVVDGDSLSKLAGRYLDDPNRSGEIFDLNRDLLENPDLLPIGTELKIPSRSSPPPAEITDELRSASLAPDGSVLGGLVPVRPIPPASAIAPRARLVQPMPAGWQNDAAR